MARYTLLSETITTAVSGVTPDDVVRNAWPEYIVVEAILTYGSGGTTAKAYVQTSLDGGTTWVDIACFAFTTATASKVSALTAHVAPGTQAFTPTDGTLTDNTVVNGVLGDRFRCKLTTTGTYAGGTTIAVHMTTKG